MFLALFRTWDVARALAPAAYPRHDARMIKLVAPLRGPTVRALGRGPGARGLVAALVAGWLVAGLAGAGTAHAQGKKRPAYCLLVTDIQAADGVPEALPELVRERLVAAIDEHQRLVATLPEGAPDPQAAPKAFTAYMKKRRLTPYRLNVEITGYHQEVETSPRGGQRLSVHVALRTFGETMPVRVMAFSGEGSATIKLDVGKRLRERDAAYADREAVTQAVGDALAESIRRLDEKRQGKPRARKKKR